MIPCLDRADRLIALGKRKKTAIKNSFFKFRPRTRVFGGKTKKKKNLEKTNVCRRTTDAERTRRLVTETP